MLIKSEDFNFNFLLDLTKIVFNSRDYYQEFKQAEKENRLNIDKKNQISKNIKFLGSYTNKKNGEYITDIDIIQVINNWTEGFYLRLRDILSKLDNTNFKFIRFYCGIDQDLILPWTIDSNGSCNFDIDIARNWLTSKKTIIQSDIYSKIYNILFSDEISLRDIITIEKILKPLQSLSWSKEEIIEGKKIHRGKIYNFLETLQNYKDKKVLKLIYNYNTKNKEEYCLVDLVLIKFEKNRQLLPVDDIQLRAYYENDNYKKIKYIKRFLSEDAYNNIIYNIRQTIGNITPLAGRIELIDKCKKYKILDSKKIDLLIEDAKQYALKNNIDTIDYDELQKIIYKNTNYFYEIYRPYIINKNLFTMFEIRGMEAGKKLSVNIIRSRTKTLKCPFFQLDIEKLNILINRCNNILIEPMLVFNCFYDICERNGDDPNSFFDSVFKFQKDYKIEKDGDYYTLKNGDSIIDKGNKLNEYKSYGLFEREFK